MGRVKKVPLRYGSNEAMGTAQFIRKCIAVDKETTEKSLDFSKSVRSFLRFPVKTVHDAKT